MTAPKKAQKKEVSADDLRAILDCLQLVEQEAMGFGSMLACSIAIELDGTTLYATYEGAAPEWKITFK